MIYYAAIFCFIFLVAAFIYWVLNRKVPEPVVEHKVDSYHNKPLLTQHEQDFLYLLEEACPEFRFHAHVSLAALMVPDVEPENRKEFLRANVRIAQRNVDYVVQDRITNEIVALVELDETVHEHERDSSRDELLIQSGYRIVRWNERHRPSVEDIRNELLNNYIQTENLL